jgi:hypothetical protein
MRALADWNRADRPGIVGVFTDIDDTLTTDGAITPDRAGCAESRGAARDPHHRPPGRLE